MLKSRYRTQCDCMPMTVVTYTYCFTVYCMHSTCR